MRTHLLLLSSRAVLIPVEFHKVWRWARVRSLKETVSAVGLLDDFWDQQSSMTLHNLSSSPRSVSACGSSSDWGLGGRSPDSITLLRNDNQWLISLKGGSPENIWGGASMESFSGTSNYCEPHISSSQSCRYQKLHQWYRTPSAPATCTGKFQQAVLPRVRLVGEWGMCGFSIGRNHTNMECYFHQWGCSANFFALSRRPWLKKAYSLV